ncbi:hypothetical protein CLOM_g14823 [Closterium sp. NIES-68]|nr:hypothetical protein CLOM_g14823 [Closterium sp. NIES-68]
MGSSGRAGGRGSSSGGGGGELSEGERAEQEERRLRMRKAMGENLMDDEEYRRKVEGRAQTGRVRGADCSCCRPRRVMIGAL